MLTTFKFLTCFEFMANKLYHFNAIQAILSDIGIPLQEANTIATASQAVDDFHESKLIVLDDGSLFYPTVTAHRMLDLKNLDSRDASNIWMPFHFYPNEYGVCAPETENVQKLTEYVKGQLPNLSQSAKLLLTGIYLHIIVDTYTHQGFIGLYCQHNDISQLDDSNVIDFGFIKGNVAPAIGHGEALSYPDDMWRNWSYKTSNGELVTRNNIEIFKQVTRKLPEYLSALGYDANELTEEQLSDYCNIFSLNTDHGKDPKSAFDRRTLANFPNGDIEYKHWKSHVIRPVQSKENRYKRIVDAQQFQESEWFQFQLLARGLRAFFKTSIFPNLKLDTKVY